MNTFGNNFFGLIAVLCAMGAGLSYYTFLNANDVLQQAHSLRATILCAGALCIAYIIAKLFYEDKAMRDRAKIMQLLKELNRDT